MSVASAVNVHSKVSEGLDLAAEAAQFLSKVEALRHELELAESQVEQQAFCRACLEAKLRCSEAREQELRQRLCSRAPEADSPVSCPSKMCSTMSMAVDSDDEAESEGSEDLECAYEGLELSGLMSVEQALQVAWERVHAKGHGSDGETCASDHEGQHEPQAEERQPAAADEATFEAPLRDLELALARLLQGQRGEAAAGSEVEAAAAETRQGADLKPYEDHLALLEKSFQRLAAAAPAEQPREGQAPPATPIGFSSLMWSPYARLGRKILLANGGAAQK